MRFAGIDIGSRTMELVVVDEAGQPPFTYLNRLLLKQRMKRELKLQNSRVRPRGID
jgi:hypothetical protein